MSKSDIVRQIAKESGLELIDLPLSKTKVEVFKKEYDGESIVDLGRDIYEALDAAYNPVFNLIPVDDHGFQKGTFTVAIVWSEEPSHDIQ